jgi:hypothetical protein
MAVEVRFGNVYACLIMWRHRLDGETFYPMQDRPRVVTKLPMPKEEEEEEAAEDGEEDGEEEKEDDGSLSSYLTRALNGIARGDVEEE